MRRNKTGNENRNKKSQPQQAAVYYRQDLGFFKPQTGFCNRSKLQDIRPSLSNDWWIVAVLCISVFLFGFFFLNKGLFHYDAIVLAEAVEKTFLTGRLQPSTNFRYVDVLVASVMYVPFWFAGKNADVAVRLTGLVFFSLSVGMTYLFLSPFLKSRVAGLSAAVFLAVSPIALSPNTFGKVQGVSLFFLMLSFWLVLQPLRWRLVFSAGTFVLSLGSREAMLFFLPFLSLLVAHNTYGKRWKEAFFFIVPLLIFFSVLWGLYFSETVLRAVFPTSIQQAGFVFRERLVVQAVRDVLVTNGWPVLVVFFAGIVHGFFVTRIPMFFLLSWVCAALFFFANFSTYEARYLDVVLPALFGLAGLAIDWLVRWRKFVGYAVFAVLLVFPVSFDRELLLPRVSYNGPLALGLLIANVTESDAVVVVQNEAPIVGYYGRRTTLGPPVGTASKSIEFWSAVRKNVSVGQHVWMTSSAFFDDPGGVNRQIVEQVFDVGKMYTLLDEDYHHSDIRHMRFITYVWKLEVKKKDSPTTRLPRPVLVKGKI